MPVITDHNKSAPSPVHSDADLIAVRTLIHQLQPHTLLIASPPKSKFAAKLFSMFYEQRIGSMSRCCGLMELKQRLSCLAFSSILLIDVAQEIDDIVGWLRACMTCEPPQIGLLTRHSLSSFSHNATQVTCVGLSQQATDSETSLASLLYRAILGDACIRNNNLALQEHVVNNNANTLSATSEGDLAEVLGRRHLAILHSHETSAAAELLQARIAQQETGNVISIAIDESLALEWRWLQNEACQTGVIVISGDLNLQSFRRLNNSLPDGVAIAAARFDKTSPLAAVAAVDFAQRFAEARTSMYAKSASAPISPGSVTSVSLAPAICRSTAAIQRKARSLNMVIRGDARDATWKLMLDAEVQKLTAQRYRSLVMDYDGTLWSGHHTPQFSALLNHTERLLRHGSAIGIATGRSAEVAATLRKWFAVSLHDRIWLGACHGADVRRLSDLSEPVPTSAPLHKASLHSVASRLRRDDILAEIATIHECAHAVTIAPKHLVSLDALWKLAHTYVLQSGTCALSAVKSGNSVDLIPDSSSKLNVLSSLEAAGIPRHQVLCIGDQGSWPGNDSELLMHPFSLSVDEPSTCWSSGWNLAPSGCRGVAATEFYLKRLLVTEPGHFRLDLSDN
jgi:hydroxymethylpyrimidine pyrophosphatase-like HAD family hydrolase